MIKLKGKTDQDIKQILKDGVKSDFWEILLQGLHESIESLVNTDTEDWVNLPAEQYKFNHEILNLKIKFLQKLLNFPKTLSGHLATEAEEEEEFDPYEK